MKQSLQLPKGLGKIIASLIEGLGAASLGLTLNPGLVVSAAFPIILQYAPRLIEEFCQRRG